ncbi:REP-associated tyrosine transposase [Pseudoalteromonas denitrificans]|uniref:REP element-mobilizing transposase RayT n=1 Tax=Pseudoalteromonas denitrificans DSM 6059 TaxID=1123010 RepID=A0A1I1UGJ6_9GAMM|nr:transposase [Pseudoalteromonas denitrificans]SFD67883.1 REP element-mobilizing transposase RayT [Pseudoalteromonas denitrificans DSM 6059]
MSRPLRLEFAGALYHVTSRGNERKQIFRNESDFSTFINVLAAVCERYNWVIHAYCLMTNHYHLLVETPDANLSKGMRQLNGVYTQGFNRDHRRVGHLFQGRYKSILVDKDSYLLALCRYIVLNPVRAKGMVDEPEEWLWSSYHETIGVRDVPDWLAIDALLRMFGSTKYIAIERYKTFVSQGKGINIWANLKSQVYLGDEAFVEKHKSTLKEDVCLELSEVPKKQVRPKPKPLNDFQSSHPHERKIAMAKAYLSGGYSMSEIASYFGVHYSTVSRAVAQCKTCPLYY